MDTGAAKPGSAGRTMLLAVGLLGLLVVGLSFLPWMAHGYGNLVGVNGTDMKGLTDAGDGWVTAIAGGAAALIAIAALLWNLRGQLVTSAITVFGLVIAAIAGYDLINGLYVPTSYTTGFFTFQQSREPALWATAAAGLGIAIAGIVLLVDASRRRPVPHDLNGAGESEGWA